MTEKGSFIVNGTERVVVNQFLAGLHQIEMGSPGQRSEAKVSPTEGVAHSTSHLVILSVIDNRRKVQPRRCSKLLPNDDELLSSSVPKEEVDLVRKR